MKEPTTTTGHNKQVVCYWASWSKYRVGDGSFGVSDIDTTLCTNIVYTFVGLDHKTSKVKNLDSWLELSEGGGHGFFEKAAALKKLNPNLKLSAGLRGFSEGSVKYSILAKDPSRRKIFVESCVDFLKKYDFDCLDFNWIYPGKQDYKIFRIKATIFNTQMLSEWN